MNLFKCVSVTGAEDVGKSALAFALAQTSGTVSVIDQSRCLGTHFNGHMLSDTVIFEECTDYNMIKSLRTNTHLQLNEMMKEMRNVPVPRLIFVMAVGFKPPNNMPNIHIS